MKESIFLRDIGHRLSVIACCLLCTFAASAANTVTTTDKVTTTVELTTDVDYIVTGASPFGTDGIVDIKNVDHAVLILSDVKPSAALKLLASHVRVNGEKAVNYTNCQVKLYNRGCIIMPYAGNYKPLTVYAEQNFEGESCSDFGLEHSGGFMNTLTEAKLNNRIRSFKLKRGYMVTFANRARGRGYSRCFIAADADLEVAVLPGVLDNSISSYRIFQWFDAGKPQLAAATGDVNACSALNVTSTYTWGVGNSMAPNVESVAHHIYEDYPSAAACGGATWTPHMKTNNEPKNSADDHPQDLETILANWESLMATGMRLCSPSSWDGSDYWNGEGFLKEFFDSIDARGWRCDILDMHCYWAEGSFPNLKNWVNAVHRPIWISEWCWGASWNNNGAFASGVTETQVRDALSRICNSLNDMDYVERYYYWNGERDISKIYKSGKLTPAGEMYAQLDGGVGYNGKYDYVPAVPTQKDPRDLVVTFDKTSHTATLSWYDPNGELNTSASVERRKSSTDSWTEYAKLTMKETAGTCTYEDGEATNGCQYRIHVVDANGKSRYSNIVTAASADLGAGDSVELDGTTKYIGGNIFTNGNFDMGSHGWQSGTGEPLAQPWFQVVPVGGYDNGPYLQAYGNGAAASESAIRTAFDIKANTDYYYSASACNTSSIYSQLCFTEDGTTSKKIIKYLQNTTSNWLTQYQTFNSGDYAKVLFSCRMLGAKTQLDNLLLAQLFDTEAEAIADGIEKARLKAAAFKEYNSLYSDLNSGLEKVMTEVTGTDQTALFALERAIAQAIQAYDDMPKLKALIERAKSLITLKLIDSDMLSKAIDHAETVTSATAIIEAYTSLQTAVGEYLPMATATTQPKQPKFASTTGWTTKCGTYTGGDQRTNKTADGVTFWNAWWSGLSAAEGTSKTMEVKQEVKSLAHGLYTLECKAATEHFCLSDQHAYITHNDETATSAALTADYFDLQTVGSNDQWQTLTTAPIYVGEGETVTIGFVGSKAGATDNAWHKIGDTNNKGDMREGWWGATDFVLKHAPLYKANVTPGQWNVTCLPYEVVPGEGVTLYQIVGITSDYTQLCVEPTEKSMAGTPVLYKSEQEVAVFLESGKETKVSTDGLGNLRGFFKTTLHVPADYYYLEGDEWLKCTQAYLDRPLMSNFTGVIRPFNDSNSQPVTIYKGWRGITIPISGITDEEKAQNDAVAKTIIERMVGDVNGDGSVDVADISSIITYMTGSTDITMDMADVNGDDSVDVADIAYVITVMAGGE